MSATTSGPPVGQQVPAPIVQLDWDTLKTLGSFLGIVGTGGGGFTVLAFGIGYLAVKNHDEMIGLPLTAVTTTSYTLTGALFFVNSLYYFFVSVALYLVMAGAATLALWLMSCVIVRYAATLSWQHSATKWRKAPRIATRLFTLASLGLLTLGVYLLHLQIAVLSAENKGLLYQRVPAPRAGGLRAAEATGEHGGPWRGRWRRVLALQGTGQLAESIRNELRSREGAAKLQRRYGWHLGLLGMFVYGTLILRWWRRQLHTAGTPLWSWLPADWVVRPLLYILAMALVLNLPATYGVLCLSKSGVWVSVTTQTDSAGESGYLLSDLASQGQEIWLLGYDDSKLHWVLRVFERKNIHIRMTGDTTPNILLPPPAP